MGVVVVLVPLDPDEEPELDEEPEPDGRLELDPDGRLELELDPPPRLELEGVLEVVREPDDDLLGDVVDCAGLLDPVGKRVLWTSETNSTLDEPLVVKLLFVELGALPPDADADDEPAAVPSSTSVS